MANDRMALICPCGEAFHLGRHFGDAWKPYPMDEFADWLEQHSLCDPAHYPTLFGVGYEGDSQSLRALMVRTAFAAGCEIDAMEDGSLLSVARAIVEAAEG